MRSTFLINCIPYTRQTPHKLIRKNYNTTCLFQLASTRIRARQCAKTRIFVSQHARSTAVGLVTTEIAKLLFYILHVNLFQRNAVGSWLIETIKDS